MFPHSKRRFLFCLANDNRLESELNSAGTVSHSQKELNEEGTFSKENNTDRSLDSRPRQKKKQISGLKRQNNDSNSRLEPPFLPGERGLTD